MVSFIAYEFVPAKAGNIPPINPIINANPRSENGDPATAVAKFVITQIRTPKAITLNLSSFFVLLIE
jgi:hypothetical protein